MDADHGATPAEAVDEVGRHCWRLLTFRGVFKGNFARDWNWD